jgi:hypothetical protein
MSGSNVVSRAQMSRDAEHEEFDSHFEIERTVEQVVTNSYKSVALQFPDELLSQSAAVYKRLQKRFHAAGRHDCRLFILGDTSYGKEYVDEVNAQHLNADFIVHYGPACVSGTSTVPVSYVFGRAPLDKGVFLSQFEAKFTPGSATKEVLLLFDVKYAYAIPDLAESIHKVCPGAVMGQVRHQPSVVRSTQRPKCCKMDGLNEVNEQEQDGESIEAPVANEGDNSCADGAQSCCGATSASSSSAASSAAGTGLTTDSAGSNEVNLAALGLTVGGLQVELPSELTVSDYTVVFIGEEGNQLTNIIMQCNESVRV